MADGPQTEWPIHGRITGPIVMIGFGSIGRGTLPLIERHFAYDRTRFTVIEPSDGASPRLKLSFARLEHFCKVGTSHADAVRRGRASGTIKD